MFHVRAAKPRIIEVEEGRCDICSAIWTSMGACGIGSYRLCSNLHRCQGKKDRQSERYKPHVFSVSTRDEERSNIRSNRNIHSSGIREATRSNSVLAQRRWPRSRAAV